MKSKTPLTLMEQLVMVLVFALAAAFCLQIFVAANRISKRNEAVSQAALMAQNTAELLKSSSEDWEQALVDNRWEKTENSWCISYDESWKPVENDRDQAYQMKILETEASVEGLVRVRIQVTDETVKGNEDDTVLFQIPVAWQEVSAHE